MIKTFKKIKLTILKNYRKARVWRCLLMMKIHTKDKDNTEWKYWFLRSLSELNKWSEIMNVKF